MKAVEMMKKAIKDSELNGYKWTANKNGLTWSYGVQFDIEITDEETGNKMVRFEDKNSGCEVVTFTVTEEDAWLVDSYHDFNTTIDEAIYWAARKMIKKANNLY